MKLRTISLATVMALTSTFALAQAGGSGATVPHKSGTSVKGGSAATGNAGRGHMHGTIGSNTRDPNGGNPNGTSGGPSTLSGTGSSQYGGSTAGTSGRQ